MVAAMKLIGFATVHILAVVVTELREGGNLISAMFSGKKVLSRPPADRTKTD
jgi:cytochrome b